MKISLNLKQPKIILVSLFVASVLALLIVRFIKVYNDHNKQLSKPEILTNLTYVPGSTDPFQTLDLYLPRNNTHKSLPVVVWIHGGAWLYGDKNHPPAVALCKKGYAVASINYRLADRFAHPAQIHDCKAAIRFLRANANKFQINSEKIGVWGHSAGGHLALLLGTSGGISELEGDLGNKAYSSKVQAVVAWAGPTNLLTIASQAPVNCKIDFKSANNPVAIFMGKSASPKDYLTASPVAYVSVDDPPTAIFHAENDDVIPVEQAKEMKNLLKKNNIIMKYCFPRTGGHALSNDKYIDESLEFFDKYLKN